MIKFTLGAPLQSWGNQDVRGDYFPTDTKPTKSCVVGLIACALGLERGNPLIGELYDELVIEVEPVNWGTILTDYHIIEANENRRIYMANGRNTGDRAATVGMVTYRSYIQNGEFNVFVDGEEDVLADIVEAFNHPYWTPYLGRKSCVVSQPIRAVACHELPENRIRLK